jgi:hypothetical protein
LDLDVIVSQPYENPSSIFHILMNKAIVINPGVSRLSGRLRRPIECKFHEE